MNSDRKADYYVGLDMGTGSLGVAVTDPQYHLLIQRDIISIINGIVDSFHGKVITKPSILRKTENKVYQMVYVSKHLCNIA